MSQQQPRRLRFRGRSLTPEQLAAAQELTWAEKNCNRLMNEAGHRRGPGDSQLWDELFEISGNRQALIEWHRRNQLT